MKKMYQLFSFWLFAILIHGSVAAQSADETRIRQILTEQTQAWNEGDLDKFMRGYWKNDSLMFIGKTGITYGWQNTLDNYKKGYPDKDAMGILSFNILIVQRIAVDCFFVVGKWNLERKAGNLNGHYTLVWKKIDGEWKIVSDHSS